MRPRRTLPALVCALALGLPAGAVAQSAGDDQYTDPFSGQQPPSAPQGSQGGSGGDSGSAPQSAQATPSPSETDPGQAQLAQDEALPRTGFEAVLPLAYGVVLLLSGVALRLGARSRPR